VVLGVILYAQLIPILALKFQITTIGNSTVNSPNEYTELHAAYIYIRSSILKADSDLGYCFISSRTTWSPDALEVTYGQWLSLIQLLDTFPFILWAFYLGQRSGCASAILILVSLVALIWLLDVGKALLGTTWCTESGIVISAVEFHWPGVAAWIACVAAAGAALVQALRFVKEP